ncbi:MAG: preprotein translocase subunit SecE [Caldilineaceae bacterium SB0662_bin_9]|uniref:Protein translocase subunit SecE n=1 Tax=Caldilineaceae bacterium SB0662_bin_9 TaxID=2605258 RepID=A0A6B1DYD6_9CHLR|nr:preprotein translocase subunit SecE [Caldilineaceae bacterium]MXZ41775.1 preprotein translocase subunit SecE [Caldilineaceae bacterium SB0666_bin_21]MYA04778.1 preprotein translocase subunit SecE [Caldilineaceae bacterium SB0664_bin_22]MYC61889.1 preprotein translocase subunit SecE [Caldilineaceae bacterium SB0661_bin_34]MYD91745.1 preprotein translocase subunit SecE [Caldilineaceae bacterium SB0662_bin_9]
MTRSATAVTGVPSRVMRFFREVRTELSKVTFPTREEGIRLTTVVMLVTLAAAGCLYALDLAFSYVITWIITL